MRPDVGRSSPPNRFNKVDLPEPDFPSKATSSPRSTSSRTPRSPTTCTDLPVDHSLVTSHKRTASVSVAEEVDRGEKSDIGSLSLVGHPLLIRPAQGREFSRPSPCSLY